MEPGSVSRKVVGVQVDALRGSRTVRMRLVTEDSEVLHIELALAIATRLTDQLVDAEYQERRVVPLSVPASPVLAEPQERAA